MTNTTETALVLDTFEGAITRRAWDGRQALVFFPNGYGVSVVSHSFSYGVEAAIVRGSAEDYDLDYTTGLASDVLGWQTPDTLRTLLASVRAL